MSPALESNAGDRYHFVYAARRLMDLLHPGTRLRLVEMEGVAAADANGRHTDGYLGVDLTEYYGGDSAETAEDVAVVQVKYSPTDPTTPWTLARLTYARPRHSGGPAPQSSVIGKLARAFTELRNVRADVRLTMRIVTNQPLAIPDAEAFGRAKAAIADIHVGPDVLKETESDTAWRNTLRSATGLDEKAFVAFLRALDISGFAGEALAATEGRLFEQIDRFTDDAHLQTDRLVAFAQESALPGRRTGIRRAHVLAQLRIHENDFIPAPPRLEPAERLFPTTDTERLTDALSNCDCGLLLVHGLAGIGKTSTVQLLTREHADRFEVVTYDCFGGGEGMHLGSERFPSRTFFTQVTNDLNVALHTNIFATCRLARDPLIGQFRAATVKGAEIAAARGKKLVICIDAIDNAAAVAARTPLSGLESFVPLLESVPWPTGCIVVCTSRTENLPLLQLPSSRSIELLGFTKEETRLHVRRVLPSIEIADADLLHERTHGTPRVQARVLEHLALAPAGADLRTIITSRARETAFEFYRAEAPDRLRLPADRSALATLVESTQPSSFPVWAALCGRPVAELQRLLSSFAFGLETGSDGAIRWRDQEFWDFLREFLTGELTAARTALANFCIAHFETDTYARDNLSRHLFAAGRDDALIDHWLAGARLQHQIEGAGPHNEGTLQDIGYALLAAGRRQRRPDVLRLLTLAADVSQGRDVFNEAVISRADVAVAEGFEPRLLAELRRAKQDTAVARTYLRYAAALGRVRRGEETARDLLHRGTVILRQEGQRREYDGGFQDEDVAHIADVDASFDGFAEAFDGLGRWRPHESVVLTYCDVVRDHLTADRAAEGIAAVRTIEEADAARALATVGLLTHASLLPPGTDLLGLAQEAAAATLPPPTLSRHLTATSRVHAAVEALLRVGAREAASALLPLAEAKAPTYSRDPELREFLRSCAFREELAGEAFDPERYRPQRVGDRQAPSEGDLEQLRRQMRSLYPAARCRVRAISGHVESAPNDIAAALGVFAERRHRSEPVRFAAHAVAGDVLHAVVTLPDRRPDSLREVRAMVDREFPSLGGPKYRHMAEVLVSDARYLRETEELLREALAHVRPPHMGARDAVDELLALYVTAQRVDPALAHECFEAARGIASAIDATIDARSTALLAGAKAVLDGGGTLSLSDLNDLGIVTEYAADIADERPVRRMEDALAIIGQTSPAVGISLALAWDRDAKLDICIGLPAVARGASRVGGISAFELAPVAAFAYEDEAARTLLEAIADSTAPGSSERSSVVDVWATAAARARGSARFSGIEAVAGWVRAHAMDASPRIGGLVAIAAAARSMGDPGDRHRSGTRIRGQEPSPVMPALRDAFGRSPLDGLAALDALGPNALRSMDFADLEQIVRDAAGSLPTASCQRLVAIISRWADSPYHCLRALPLLARVTEGMPLAARTTVQSAARTLLAPETLRMGMRGTIGEESEARGYIRALSVCWRGAETALFDIVADILARNLDAFATDDVYRWIAELVRLTPLGDARAYLDYLRERLRTSVPSPRAPLSVHDRDAHEVLRGIVSCLGHRRLETRYRALYALSEVLLQGDPATLQIAMEQLEDVGHPRWMTRREWLLFALHHVALLRPTLLVPYAAVFAAHATSRTFPHAKCRYHAREIVLRILSLAPDSLDGATRIAVETAQQPTSIVARVWDHSEGSSERWSDLYKRSFVFNEMDTLPYWYDPLGDCFNVSRWAVAKRAERWILQTWGITEAACSADAEANRHNDDWRTTMNDHGSEPSVETLHLYAERHGMFMAAGELVDTLPVAKEEHGLLDGWTDWLRYHVREADPSLPSRLLREPPLEPENYGMFPTEFEVWRSSRSPADYEQHIRDGEWFVLNARKEGTHGERDSTVTVEAAFAPRETAAALVRAITDAAEPPPLPVQDLHYDSIVPEIEDDLRRNAAAYSSADGNNDEIIREPPLFTLRPTAIVVHQELPFHGQDSRWPSFSRNYPFPTRAVEEVLQASRLDPLRLEWRAHDGTIVMRSELWQDGKEGDEADGVEGFRLLIHRDALAALLAATGEDIVLSVTIRRQKTYRYRGRGSDNGFDRGTTRAYAASSLLGS